MVNLINGLYKKEHNWINQPMINPLKILILNLMPDKQETEKQFIKIFSQIDFNIEISFLYLKSHRCKNTNNLLLRENYFSFEQVKKETFNGLIITGAPVERLDFQKVDYWSELKRIRDWSKSSVKETFNECWSAQAGLFQDYEINKINLKKKLFEISNSKKIDLSNDLMIDMQEISMPQSRRSQSIINHYFDNHDLTIVARDESDSPLIIQSKKLKQIYVMGHPEYDANRLDIEYQRDKLNNKKINKPDNYYDDNGNILNTWSISSIKLFSN